MDIGEYHGTYIEGGAEGAQYFRSQKAQEYPDDDRNERSARALTKLEENLRRVPLDNPLLMECYKLEITQWDGPDDALWEKFHQELGEGRNHLFGRYGFDGPEDGNAEAFLKSYLDMVKECCEEAFGREY